MFTKMFTKMCTKCAQNALSIIVRCAKSSPLMVTQNSENQLISKFLHHDSFTPCDSTSRRIVGRVFVSRKSRILNLFQLNFNYPVILAHQTIIDRAFCAHFCAHFLCTFCAHFVHISVHISVHILCTFCAHFVHMFFAASEHVLPCLKGAPK